MAVWRVPIFAATQTRCSAVDSFQHFLFSPPPCAVISAAMWSAERSQNALVLKNKRVWWCLCTVKKDTTPATKADNSVPRFVPNVLLYVSAEGWEGGERGGGEREKMQSSACLSGHTIQHREKPFIQHSLPTTPSKLPSNSERAWMDSLAWQHRATASLPPPHPPTPLCSQPDSVCSSQLAPLSHSVRPPLHPEHLCSVSFMYFLRVTALTSSLLHKARLHYLQFRSRAAATLLCRPLIHSVGAPFSYFFSTLLLSPPHTSLSLSFLFPHNSIHCVVQSIKSALLWTTLPTTGCLHVSRLTSGQTSLFLF